MTTKLAYRRLLLKLSGETLKGKAPDGVDPEAAHQVARQIQAVVDLGVQTALVIGGGNIFRGLPASRRGGLDRATADTMGMLATVMNAVAMEAALEANGQPARVMTAIPMPGIGEAFDRRRALRHLQQGRVVLFAGGTGHPFFTTDTTAALRACEIGADAIFKATKVNGIFTADPVTHPDAKRYANLSTADAVRLRLGVMDATAFSLCMENDMPIVVFNFFKAGSLLRVVRGDLRAATTVGPKPTRLA